MPEPEEKQQVKNWYVAEIARLIWINALTVGRGVRLCVDNTQSAQWDTHARKSVDAEHVCATSLFLEWVGSVVSTPHFPLTDTLLSNTESLIFIMLWKA